MGDNAMKTATGKRTALNPCKCCGYTQVRRTDRVYLGLDYGYLIQCPKCRAKAPMGYLIQDAVDAWNIANPIKESEATA
jgi:hypothetical protein